MLGTGSSRSATLTDHLRFLLSFEILGEALTRPHYGFYTRVFRKPKSSEPCLSSIRLKLQGISKALLDLLLPRV